MSHRSLAALGLAIALAAFGGAANADRYELGSRTIEIPAPTGFVAASTRSAVLMSSFRESFPAEIRVIELYASTDELAALGSSPALDRFFSISVAKPYQDFRVTEKQFAPLMDMLDKDLAADAGHESVFYRREAWAAFYAAGAALLPAYEETRERYCTNAMARIDETPVQFMSCTLVRSDVDREWLRTAMYRWVKSVYDANPPRSDSPRSETRVKQATRNN